ncbi:hypothetical protein IB276_17795 [Ensifer sp. ENS04]|uniref:hypothetical protein n=1 Tax=Ensifer sp. ENS04 TaxID=2769281 RepID=UPI001780AC1A|nr:hypothetical protein [Ensifer sp. ENS04]MBD9541311.1 hypothetical protein [Ensifer sp. ENS04]
MQAEQLRGEDDAGDGNQGGSQGTSDGMSLQPRGMAIYDELVKRIQDGRLSAVSVNVENDPSFEFPSLHLLEYETLGNGYKIAFYNGWWLLYDENDRPVGRFRSAELAERHAYELCPPPVGHKW